MPYTRDELAGLAARHKVDPDAFISQRLAKLDAIIASLRANPLAHCMRIFGSAVNAPDMIPGDIDCFVSGRTGLDKETRRDSRDNLLMLSVEGGYHGNYGLLDPFIYNSNNGKLFTRNEEYSLRRIAWNEAAESTKPGIIQAGLAGVPLLEFKRDFTAEFGSHNLENQMRP